MRSVLKRILRPLIPDRLMARYRLQQHSRQVRTNVDVLVEDERTLRRWLAVTPDTYRVGLLREQPDVTAAPGILGVGDSTGVDQAQRLLTRADAVVVAQVIPPRLVGRRRVEPKMQATAIVTTAAVADAVGGVPEGSIVGFHRRIIDAGYRVRLIPRQAAVADVQRRDRVVRPTVVVLAAVPMYDVGGGARSAQLAVEFLGRGYHVVYVTLFGSHETVDLGLRFVHPHLEQYRFDEFDATGLIARVSSPGFVVLELPAATLESTVHLFQEAAWKVVYDVVDRWSDPALGGDWYREDIESRLVATADLVTASAPDLVDLIVARGRAPLLIPNGVNHTVFSREPGPLPADFPTGSGPVLGYHGSLYGDWFDWDQVAEVARSRESARVVLIGDVPANAPTMPSNVHLLGLKAQGSLPEYLAGFDVGLVPFVISETTHAVSPLKVFEYLACGIPVAAPPLRSLQGIAGVVTADPWTDAVEGALRAPRPDRVAALRVHSWTERVERLLSALGVVAPDPAPVPTVVVRPAVHFGRGERRL